MRVVDRDFELGVHRACIRLDVARAIWFPRLERPSFISAITIRVLRVLHLALEKVAGVERAIQREHVGYLLDIKLVIILSGEVQEAIDLLAAILLVDHITAILG